MFNKLPLHQLSLHPWQGIRPIFKKVVKTEFDDWVPELLSTIAVPMAFFLAFGLGLQRYIMAVDGYPYMVFMAPGLISLTILMEAYRTGAWGLWLGRWHNKMLSEFRVKPISTSDIIIGQILGGFVVAILKGAVVGLILFMLAPFTTSFQNVGLYLLYLFPGCILFTCIGTMVGTHFRKPDQIAQSQTIVITPLLYLGGLFFPISAYPQWSQKFVRLLPTTALFDGGRDAFLAGQYDSQYLWVLLFVSTISFALSVWWFNRKLAK